MQKKDSDQPVILKRRELIGKYGMYTAPVVVSLLVPSKTYSDPGMIGGATLYSTASACQADLGANTPAAPFHGGAGGRHCMVGGQTGGGLAHDVIDPLN